MRSDLEPNSPLNNLFIASVSDTQREYIWEVSHWGFVYKNSPSPLAKIFGIKTADAAEELSYKIRVSAIWEIMPTKIESVIGYSGKFYINLSGIGGYMYLKNKQVEQKNNSTVQIISSRYSGWTGGGAQLTINNDGSVVYEAEPGRESVEQTKVIKTIQLSNKELQEIKTLVINSNVFNYKDNYDCKSDCPTDGPSEGIRFIIDGKEKIISLSVRRNTPESLEQIIGKINSIIQENFL